MSHTPGPWHSVDCRHQQNGQIRIFNSKGRIANVVASNDDCLDNARLIAAAPELLEACKKTIEENMELADGEICTLIHLKRAIAKAEGRS